MPEGPISVLEVLDLRSLPDDGLEYDEALPEPWIDTQLAELGSGPAAIHARRPGHARLEVSPLSPVATRPPIRVHGDITATVATTCVRCLSPIDEELSASIELILYPAEQAHAHRDDSAGTDDELTAGQLDEGSYEGSTLDVPGLVREALLLEVSMNPRCEDEAACSDRTEALLAQANRAASSMGAGDRWAALRRLREAHGEPSPDPSPGGPDAGSPPEATRAATAGPEQGEPTPAAPADEAEGTGGREES